MRSSFTAIGLVLLLGTPAALRAQSVVNEFEVHVLDASARDRRQASRNIRVQPAIPPGQPLAAPGGASSIAIVRTGTDSAAGVLAGENLTPFAPSGWSAPIVVSNLAGTTTDAGTIYSDENVYVDWAVVNNGSGTTVSTFYSTLYVDGVEMATWYSLPPVPPGSYAYVLDANIGALPPGTHTFRIMADVTGVIPETNELDNEYSRTKGITLRQGVNLTPYQPYGWGAPIVISKVTGTNTDASVIYSDEAVFIDWAVINNGVSSTQSTFYVDLLVDSTVVESWYVDFALAPDYYVFVEDQDIGTLSPGNHTVRIVADPTNTLAENNETDNSYSRTKYVTARNTPPDISVTPLSLTIRQPGGTTSALAASPAIARLDFSQPHVTGELVVKLRADSPVRVRHVPSGPETGIPEMDLVFRSFGTYRMANLHPRANTPAAIRNTMLVRFSRAFDPARFAERLRSRPEVEWVDLNYLYPLSEVPDDPMYTDQWHLPKIRAAEAWDLGTGSPGIIVGIIDTGVDWDHPDLAANIWMNPGETAGNGIDDDGNGFVDDVRAWDWVSGVLNPAAGEDGDIPDNNPMDFDGHGSHCAGIASAVTNNGTGVAAIGRGCRIMALRAGYRASDGNGYVQFAAAASAIDYAVMMGARVISMSFGGGSALQPYVAYAYQNNVVVVHAAGNDNADSPSPIDGIPETISVAATDQNDVKASFSSFGAWVDVSAPGVSIRSTVFNNGYANYSGTSMAAPLVAGLAGLLLSQDPGLSNLEIAQIIAGTADNIDAQNPAHAGQLGGGRVNALNAMQHVSAPGGIILSNVGGSTLTVTAVNADRPWMLISGPPPVPFTIAPGATRSAVVNVDWAQVAGQSESGQISILSNDTDQPSVTVGVTAVKGDVPVLSVTPGSRAVTASAGITTFSVANSGGGSMTYSASVTAGAAWLSITGGATGGNGGTITAAFAPNAGPERSGVISVAAPGASGSPVDVTVTQAAGQSLPPWTFINTGVSHSLIVPLAANPVVNGTPLQPGDYIGVFYDSGGTLRCAGYEQWTGSSGISLSAFGNDPLTPAPDGFAAGETFKWKIYESSGSTTHAAAALFTPPGGIVTHTDRYETDGISQLASLIGGVTAHALTLRAGWGMISCTVDPADHTLDIMFQPVSADMIILKNGEGRSYIPSVPVNTIGPWVPAEGYQLKMYAARDLDVIGLRLVPELSPIAVPAGWSMIPYLRTSELPVETALSGILGDIIIVKDQDGRSFIPSVSVNTIGTMKPGQGYQIKMSAARALTYPLNGTSGASVAGAADAGVAKPERIAARHYPEHPATGNNATLVLPSDCSGNQFDAGDELAVFDAAGSVVGSAPFADGALAVAIWGDDPTTEEKDGLSAGEPFSIRRWNRAEGREERVTVTQWREGGGVYVPDALAIAAGVRLEPADEVPQDRVLLTSYPNPFNSSSRIMYSVPAAGFANVSVYNILGQLVAGLVDEHRERGLYEVTFEARTLPSGAYIIRAGSGGHTAVRRVMLLK